LFNWSVFGDYSGLGGVQIEERLGIAGARVFFYFLPSVDIFQRDFKRKIEKLSNRYDTQCTQSNAGKQSWSRTALKRCNNTEILWKGKHVSQASPELAEIL